MFFLYSTTLFLLVGPTVTCFAPVTDSITILFFRVDYNRRNMMDGFGVDVPGRSLVACLFDVMRPRAHLYAKGGGHTHIHNCFDVELYRATS